MLKESISIAELPELDSDSFAVIDIRNELDYEYGHINGAVNIPLNKIEEDYSALPEGKTLIICCKSGLISDTLAEKLRESGYDALNLEEGYYGWLRMKMQEDNAEVQNKAEQVEKSLHTEFEQSIWLKFLEAVDKYELVKNGDHIAVCISGGKDSMLMAKLFGELKKLGKYDFEVTYLVMDPGYSPQNREVIENNAQRLNIPIKVFESQIFQSVYNVDKNPCYLCARMRRGYLYKNARLAGCNKIALGHHYDDVIETVLMSILYSGQVRTMMPKLFSENYEGMELIRPLYLVREDEIKRWRDSNDLHFIACACRFTDTCTTCNPTGTGSKRMEIKNLIRELKAANPQVEENIFHSMENVDLDSVIAYNDSENVYRFD
ncbi:MAG: ATP-binding protein [Oscillospiraceae bacterium]